MTEWNPQVPLFFTVPGEPVAKERPRFGKGGSVRTPAKTHQAEETIGWYFLQAYPRYEPRADLLYTVQLTFCVGNWQKDWDNLGKTVSDALNGLVWRDDSQIISAMVLKSHEPENPRTLITIWEHPEGRIS